MTHRSLDIHSIYFHALTIKKNMSLVYYSTIYVRIFNHKQLVDNIIHLCEHNKSRRHSGYSGRVLLIGSKKFHGK